METLETSLKPPTTWGMILGLKAGLAQEVPLDAFGYNIPPPKPCGLRIDLKAASRHRTNKKMELG